MKTLSIALMMLAFAMQLNAQDSLALRKFNQVKHHEFELGVLAGFMIYSGDVHSEKFLLKAINLNAGAYLRYHVSDQLSARANLLLGQLSGNDNNFNEQWRYERGFSFKSNVVDLSVTAEYEPFAKFRYRKGVNNFSPIFSPYAHAGLGVLATKIKTVYSEGANSQQINNINIDKGKTPNLFLSLPVGVGVRYDFTPRWTMGAEGTVRVPMSDYLDGISKSANPDANDWYYTFNMTMGYRLDYKRDADGDAVPDKQDACPTEPGVVDKKGCPDKDGDGVIDRLDQCPDEKGNVKLFGCPDSDSDGVADKEDKCPYKSGEKRYKGCPDTDGDGVIDAKDACPTAKGLERFNGCPDTDGDGIMDNLDKCPTAKGTKEDNGCPMIDKDEDGVADKDDVCPDKAGRKENNGCPLEPIQVLEPTPVAIIPAITVEEKEVFDEALYGVEFETGSADLTKNSYKLLDKVVGIMLKRSKFNFEIGGHTDNVGADKKNQRISEERAKAVFAYLVKKGVNENRLTAVGYGDTQPVEANNTEKGRAKNRRVAFTVK